MSDHEQVAPEQVADSPLPDTALPSTPLYDSVRAQPLATRIPTLWHTALLLLLTVLAFAFVEGLLVATSSTPLMITLQDGRKQLAAEVLAYVVSLTAAWFVFPLLWHRSFLAGISWNARAAKPWWLVFGLLLGFLTQAAESLLPLPQSTPLDKFFHSDELIWPLVLLGTVVAPVFEEILFRGFLLPACALAVDWFRVPRESLAYEEWRGSDGFSTTAVTVASFITSALFALIHAPQLANSAPAVALLAVVSLVLCLVRLRTRSVAASTLVHAFYNLSVFISLFIVTAGFKHLERAG